MTIVIIHRLNILMFVLLMSLFFAQAGVYSQNHPTFSLSDSHLTVVQDDVRVLAPTSSDVNYSKEAVHPHHAIHHLNHYRLNSEDEYASLGLSPNYYLLAEIVLLPIAILSIGYRPLFNPNIHWSYYTHRSSTCIYGCNNNNLQYKFTHSRHY